MINDSWNTKVLARNLSVLLLIQSVTNFSKIQFDSFHDTLTTNCIMKRVCSRC